MTKFIDLYNLILEELTDAQKRLVDDSYSDTYGDDIYHINSNTDLSKFTLNQLYKLTQNDYIFSKKQLMSILHNFSDVTLTEFLSTVIDDNMKILDDMHILCNNIDRELIETFLQKIKLNGFIHELLGYNKIGSVKLSKEDIFYLFEKYASQFDARDIYLFLDNIINFTIKDIDYILEHSFNLLQKDALMSIFSIFNSDQLLEKYLEKAVNKYPSIFDSLLFCVYSNFSAELIIKLDKKHKISKKTIECIFKYNKHLSDEDKNKLENLLFTY